MPTFDIPESNCPANTETVSPESNPGQSKRQAFVEIVSSEWDAKAGTQVTIASSTNATPIQINTSANHGYSNGDRIYITGHRVNEAANGIWTITVVDNNSFTLDGSVGSGVGVATGLSIKGFLTWGIQRRDDSGGVWERWLYQTIRIGSRTRLGGMPNMEASGGNDWPGWTNQTRLRLFVEPTVAILLGASVTVN